MPNLTAVRGATTSPANEAPAVAGATRELLTALGEANPGLTPASTVALFFTVTPDLDSTFPATTAREQGFGEAALLGALEAPVTGAPERCIRVLALFTTDEHGRPVAAHRGSPVYLSGAAALRPDLISRKAGPATGGELR